MTTEVILKQFSDVARSQPRATRPLRTLLRDNLSALALPALKIAYEDGGPIGRVLAEEIRRSNDIQLLATLYNYLHNGLPSQNGMPLFPTGNVTFGQVAIAVGRKVLEVALNQPNLEPLRQGEGVALFTNLAAWHGVLGQGRQAQRVAALAVRFFTAGAPLGTPVERANYARTLDALSAAFRQQGLARQGRKAGADAADLYRSLIATGHDEYRADLARSLVNWAGGLDMSIDSARRHAAYEEAVALYRPISVAPAPEYRKELCETLIGYASTLAAMGDLTHAETIGREAVTIAENLGEHSDSFRQLQVMAECNLAHALQHQKRPTEAIEYLQKAISDARFLVRQSKEAYAPLYVHCLTICTNALVDANRVEEAYACMNEAVTVLPDGLAGDTAGQSALLAQRHFNLSILAYETARNEEALKAATRARSLYQVLAGNDPERYQGIFASLSDIEAGVANRQKEGASG